MVDDTRLLGGQAISLEILLAPGDLLWVGVRSPLPVVERRERGDRTVGQAGGQTRPVHSWTGYDLGLDTSVLTPVGCAQAILEAVTGRRA